MLRVVRIIWAALFVAILIYCALAFFLAQKNASQPFDANFNDVLVPIIYGMAAVTFGVAYFMRARLRALGRPLAVYSIVGWALFEAVSIYGLVLAFVHLDWRLIVAPAAVSIAGFITTFPGEINSPP